MLLSIGINKGRCGGGFGMSHNLKLTLSPTLVKGDKAGGLMLSTLMPLQLTQLCIHKYVCTSPNGYGFLNPSSFT